MSSPKRDPAEVSAILARKAEADATAVREFAANTEIADSIIGFHAQQAVEKWLKAVIANRGEDFEFTHDLHRLVNVAARVGAKLPGDPDAVLVLTQYAVPLRYEDLLDAERLDREATVALVEEVAGWATAQLES
ncbi:MAG TPA: HEPN domain-containing protein [Solirubrobacterales bacterium]|nr:HEPN domain-containing protein [Solirubrobacterales bacterium]